MRKILLILVLLILLGSYASVLAQSGFIPVAMVSPLFNHETNKMHQLGFTANNYGLHLHIAGQQNRMVYIVGYQHNDGRMHIDPMGLNKYMDPLGQQAPLLQAIASEMQYTELALGYNHNVTSKSFSLMGGVGREWKSSSSRLFLQVDWGYRSDLTQAGLSLRTNYTWIMTSTMNEAKELTGLLILQPGLHFGIRFRQLLFVAEYGLSLPIKRKHDYAMALFGVGLVYTFSR